jgi:AcrR family transcriptional regulator
MAAGSAGRKAHQLPPGRHGLSRTFVVRNQRDRILKAVAESVYESGFAQMSVEDVVRRAGISRKTFYEQFPNKDEAFLAAFDEAAAQLIEGVRCAYAGERTFPARLIAGYRAFLELLALSPEFANMCIVEVLAAGPVAVAKRTAVMQDFARMIHEIAHETRRAKPVPLLTAETTVGGVYETIFRKIAADKSRDLPQLLPDVVEFTLLPYVGERRAQTAAARARSQESAGDYAPAPSKRV